MIKINDDWSQWKKVLEHLKHYGTITVIEAQNKYECYRLAARIEQLRKKGFSIKTNEIPKKSGKGTYAQYKLEA